MSNTAVTSSSEAGWERRARRLPWGIEIQIWRLVETKILPETAANLPISALLSDGKDGDAAGAIPAPRPAIDEDPTLENLIELEYVSSNGEG
jgi:hypothetical protein